MRTDCTYATKNLQRRSRERRAQVHLGDKPSMLGGGQPRLKLGVEGAALTYFETQVIGNLHSPLREDTIGMVATMKKASKTAEMHQCLLLVLTLDNVGQRLELLEERLIRANAVDGASGGTSDVDLRNFVCENHVSERIGGRCRPRHIRQRDGFVPGRHLADQLVD